MQVVMKPTYTIHCEWVGGNHFSSASCDRLRVCWYILRLKAVIAERANADESFRQTIPSEENSNILEIGWRCSSFVTSTYQQLLYRATTITSLHSHILAVLQYASISELKTALSALPILIEGPELPRLNWPPILFPLSLGKPY